MEYRSQNNGFQTYMQHCGMLVPVLVAVVVSEALTFFFNLSGKPWICFFMTSAFLLISGATLIVYAKIPIYRSGRFFTFGIKSVPQNMAVCYRWGWRIFLFGAALSICLLLSKH